MAVGKQGKNLDSFSGDPVMVMVTLAPSGSATSVMAVQNLPGPDLNTLEGSLATADGIWTAARTAPSFASPTTWLLKLDAKATVTQSINLGKAGGHPRFVKLLQQAADGGIVAIVQLDDPLKSTLVHLTNAGVVQSSKVLPIDYDGSVITQFDGQYLLGTKLVWDAWGNEVGAGFGGVVLASSAQGDGVWGGIAQTDQQGAWVISRRSFWGAPCGGACAVLTWKACQDSNPCTTNWCTPEAKGCALKVLPDGATCGLGKVCKLGTCT